MPEDPPRRFVFVTKKRRRLARFGAGGEVHQSVPPAGDERVLDGRGRCYLKEGRVSLNLYGAEALDVYFHIHNRAFLSRYFSKVGEFKSTGKGRRPSGLIN
jgi:hypothetical protein